MKSRDAVLLVCLLLWVSGTESTLEPQEACVPTAVTRGPCHTCVCTVYGVFHCRAEECSARLIKLNKKGKKQCDPLNLYRHDTQFCSCNPKGYWISVNCYKTFRYLKQNKAIMRIRPEAFKCTSNAFYIVDCNVCKCNSRDIIQVDSCTNRVCSSGFKSDPCKHGDILRTETEFCVCSDLGYYVDSLCFKIVNERTQRVHYNEMVKIISDDRSWRKTGGDDVKCPANATDAMDCNRINSNLTQDAIANLSVITKGDDCIPGDIYKLDCNTCKCGEDKTLLCTRMACLRVEEVEKLTKLRNKKGKETKLVKKTKGNKDKKKMYQNNRSKKTLPNLPKGDCVPGKIYKNGCLKCFCTEKNNPVCSQKACDANEETDFIESPDDVHPKLNGKKLDDLPSLRHQAEKCLSGKAYRVDCNYCLCLENGNLLCGKMLCLSIEDVNRVKALKSSGKECSDDDILMHSDCVTCKCIAKVTKCEPILGCVPLAVRRHMIGRTQEKTIMSLAPNGKSCVPNMVYKSNCNECYCQYDGSMRCTARGCFNFQQARYLDQQREKLMKKGH